MQTEPRVLFDNASDAAFKAWGKLEAFRIFTRNGLLLVTPSQRKLTSEKIKPMASIFNMTDEQVEEAINAETQTALRHADRTINEASIILAHTILDGLTEDYLRVTRLADAPAWEALAKNKKIKIKVSELLDVNKLIQKHIDQMVNESCRDSLLNKIDRLFQICQPQKQTQDVHFDRKKLKVIDDLRHNLVHKNHSEPSVEDTDGKIEFLKSVHNILGRMLREKYWPRPLRRRHSMRSHRRHRRRGVALLPAPTPSINPELP